MMASREDGRSIQGTQNRYPVPPEMQALRVASVRNHHVREPGIDEELPCLVLAEGAPRGGLPSLELVLEEKRERKSPHQESSSTSLPAAEAQPPTNTNSRAAMRLMISALRASG
jgi:hypothetical protein